MCHTGARYRLTKRSHYVRNSPLLENEKMAIRRRVRAVDDNFEPLHELESRLRRYVEALEKRVVFNEAEIERISAQLKATLNRTKKQAHFKMTQLIMRTVQVKDALATLEKSEKNE